MEMVTLHVRHDGALANNTRPGLPIMRPPTCRRHSPRFTTQGGWRSERAAAKIPLAVQGTKKSGEGSRTGREGEKIDYPVGHAGVSHCNKATQPARRHRLEFDASPCYGLPLVGLRPGTKMISYPDGARHMQHMVTLATREWDADVRTRSFIDCTSFGPVMLGIMLFMFGIGVTDRNVTDF